MAARPCTGRYRYTTHAEAASALLLFHRHYWITYNGPSH